MKSGFRGTFVISWAQTEIDGLPAAPVPSLTVGSAWRWRGEMFQVDAVAGVLRLDRTEPANALRQRAARAAEKLTGLSCEAPADDDEEGDAALEGSFTVTDGVHSYRLKVLLRGFSQQPLLVLENRIPPRDKELWVVSHSLNAAQKRRSKANRRGVICFAEGTRIAVPGGQAPVEALQPGDFVLTKDNGPQPIQWIGARHFCGARLFAMPHLRPIRIRVGALGVERPDQELLVSPQHRLLVENRAVRDLFGSPEVLVAARDLEDGDRIVTDHAVSSVSYFHLLLPGHNIVWANGVASESFHPAATSLATLDPMDRNRLLELLPTLQANPLCYGSYARRTLTQGEAAIMQSAA